VYAQVITELLAQEIAAKTAGNPKPDEMRLGSPHDTNRFYKLHSGQRLVEFAATDCSVQKERVVELSGDVMVVEYDALSKQHLRTLWCKKAKLYIEGDELAPTLTMEVYDPIWQRADGEKGVSAGRTRIRGLIVPQSIETVTNKFRTESSLKAVELASQSPIPQNPPGSKLEELQGTLRKKIQKTLAEIEAETHSRLVFGIGCVSMIMIGIGLGVIFRGGHLLSAFGVSCVPAAVLIVCIMGGKQLVKNLGAAQQMGGSGTILMWAGLVILSLLAVVMYRKLLKN
jgi:hypothetical protein